MLELYFAWLVDTFKINYDCAAWFFFPCFKLTHPLYEYGLELIVLWELKGVGIKNRWFSRFSFLFDNLITILPDVTVIIFFAEQLQFYVEYLIGHHEGYITVNCRKSHWNWVSVRTGLLLHGSLGSFEHF